MSAARIDLHRLARDLGGEVSGGQVLAPGPNHKSPHDRSLSVKLDPKAPEGFLVNSFANDDPLACRDYVRQKAGLPEWEPQKVAPLPAPQRRTVVAEYLYRHADGTPYLRVQRTSDKKFWQSHWDGATWRNGKPAGPKIPYRLPELLAAVHDTVFVCEGEKDVENLTAAGFVATSASEGAGKWTADLAPWFKGKSVYVLADNDDAGRAHAVAVAASLKSVAAEVRIVHLPGLPEKGDVSDWLAAGGRDLLGVSQQAPLYEPGLVPDAPVEPQAPDWVRPFKWRDPSTLPRREWVYGDHYIRQFVSATFSPGGIGKSSLEIAEAIAMASGKPILGIKPKKRVRVAYWNGEDPFDETERRAMAIALHYGLTPDDLEGWLFLGSGREAEVIIATQTPSGALLMQPNVDRVRQFITDQKIEVAIIDPFVSSHRVTENDNPAIDLVAKTWGKIAGATNSAVELVHHTRKTNGAEITVEDGRGAGALLAAARSARVLNVMSKDEAERAGIDARYHRSYFRVDNGKANMAPPPEGSRWHRFVGVDLGNGDALEPGDNVGVVTAWEWPDPFEGVSAADLLAVQRKIDGGHWRENIQAKEWAGHAVAEVLGLDAKDKADRTRIKGLLHTWLKADALVVSTAKDETHRERPVIEVGRWVEL